MVPGIFDRRGFTLIEILVALAVLSIISMAVMNSGGAAVENAAYLKNRTLAHWVAMNKAAELQLSPEWVAVATVQGAAEMAGREWRWSVTGQETPDSGIRRADIKVRRDEDDEEPLATLLIFLGRPVTP